MKKSVLPAILLIFFVLFSLCGSGAAQRMPEPYQEKLLNGLKVLVWNDPAADKVTVKLRIHSGAAFDPKDKMGVMALLSDIIFPDPQTFNYFEEDLNGKLEVTSNYDYIQITATGKGDEFVNILDTIRAGIVNTAINQENFVKVRDARLEKAKEESAKPGTIADRAAAKRLLGDFPYGRPAEGTPESLAKIDRFDLVAAREKFLDADNATLSITGKIDARFAVKAAKQLMGSWGKSEGLVPATFAQPGEPDTRIQLIDQPGAATAEIRFAVRGLAMNDNDTPALMLWSYAFEKKIDSSLPGECRAAVQVEPQVHLLPGLLMIKAAFPVEVTGKCFAALKSIIDKADSDKVKPEDFKMAQYLIIHGAAETANPALRSGEMLNADTFKLGKGFDLLNLAAVANPAAGEKVATRIFWKSPVVSVIVGDAAKIRPQFDASAIFALTPEQEDQIKKEVADFMNSWKTSIEKRDIDAHMKYYAAKLEVFYQDKDKDQSTVRAEREKGFQKFDSIKIELSKISIQPDSENTVHLIFDKKWNFHAPTATSTGAVQQLMKLVKANGQWQIAEEKDLQIYYMDNKQIPPPAKPQ